HGVPHGQDEDARGDLDLAREGGRVGEHVERLQPGIAVETGRGEEMIDDPHVDAVLLALLDRLPDAREVPGIALAAAPGIGRDPPAELQFRHSDDSSCTGDRERLVAASVLDGAGLAGEGYWPCGLSQSMVETRTR